MQPVDDLLKALCYSHDDRWAKTNFVPFVRALIEQRGYHAVMELGGGCAPSLSEQDVNQLGIRYTSNDISQKELAMAPAWVDKALFDILTDDDAVLAPFEGAYDFVFSKMLMEHVPDYRKAYRTIARLLRPGGMALAFHPTLFAFPFVVNYLLPGALSQQVLQFLQAHRAHDKFPAHYSGCYVSKGVRETIQGFGLSEVQQVPFYSHHYYDKIPVIRAAHRHMAGLAAACGFSLLSAYSYTIVRK